MKRAAVPTQLWTTVGVLFLAFAALGYCMARRPGGVTAQEGAVVAITGVALGLLAWAAVGSRRS